MTPEIRVLFSVHHASTLILLLAIGFRLPKPSLSFSAYQLGLVWVDFAPPTISPLSAPMGPVGFGTLYGRCIKIELQYMPQYLSYDKTARDKLSKMTRMLMAAASEKDFSTISFMLDAGEE